MCRWRSAVSALSLSTSNNVEVQPNVLEAAEYAYRPWAQHDTFGMMPGMLAMVVKGLYVKGSKKLDESNPKTFM